MDMIKRMPLEEMRVRVENLKKLFGADYVDTVVSYFKSQAEHEIDVLYLTFFHIRRCQLRYCPNAYGQFTEVPYQRKRIEWVYSKPSYYTVNSFYGSYNPDYGMVYTYAPNGTI